MAIIFEQMWPQAPAILAIDDSAAAGAGVALVGCDQFQRVAEQFDMFEIDRGDAGLARADQSDRIIAATDAGLEHDEFAAGLLEMKAGEREQCFERAELFASSLRNPGDGGLNLLPAPREGVVTDLGIVDPDPFVEAQQMRGREQAGS